MKIIKLMILSLIIGFSNNLSAQNGVWTLPPYYQQFPNTSPIPLPTVSTNEWGYHGDPATTVSNAMQDANGNLLFFIVDGVIYDKDGYTIGVIDFLINATLYIKGTAEVAIAPVPGNCSQYYIFMAGRSYYINSSSNKEPVVALLDMSEPSTIASNRMGELIYGSTIEDILPSSAPAIIYDEYRQGSSYFAVSKEHDGRRFVFISNPRYIYRFIIDAAGLNYDGVMPVTYFAGNNDTPFRGEMELVEVNNANSNVKYRLAFYLPHVPPMDSLQLSSNLVYIYNLDVSGNITFDNNGIDKYYLPYENSPQILELDRAYIHGLEFSPNGNILYITHQANVDYPNAFEYFDFNNTSAGVQAVPGVTTQQSLNFENSQIEIGKSGNFDLLYLAHAGGLATFSNPNTPSQGVLNLSSQTFLYSPNFEGNPSNETLLKSYMLPDQIDGMDYSSIGYPSLHNITTYTAASGGTWQPGSNPWNTNVSEFYVQDKLIIPSGKNITIQNMTFHFAPDAKVIVEQGGKLTLNNSVFTNANVSCDNSEQDYWQGVQVYGTTNQNQFPLNNPTHQGMLVIQNGSTIEYAHVATTNWRDDYWNEIGGVIQSNNGVFRNNRIDVAFMAYNNFSTINPNNILDNNSFFRNTEFISDDDYIEGYTQRNHVVLWGVKGINFTNCHFVNNVTNKVFSSAPKRGIYSVDAGFRVRARCSTSIPIGQSCPTSNLLRSSFTGLHTAIEASGAATSKTVVISQSIFDKNVNGILINELDNISIDRNTMFVKDPGYSLLPYFLLTVKGIEINNSTGFIVEENDITGTYSPSVYNTPKSHGVIIKNAGSANNRVYKNNLSSLYASTSSIGINRYDFFYVHTGLQFLCNNYQNYKYAINIGDEPNNGMRLYQGEYNANSSLSVPAGNIFNSSNPFFPSWDINNNTNGSIVYFHNPNVIGSTPENPSGFNYVTLSSTMEGHSCPTSFGGGVIGFPFPSYAQKIDSLKSVQDNLSYNYYQLLDDGSTEQMLLELNYSWTDEVWELREKLIESSPFLSEEVLLNVASKNTLPHPMLLEVLLANPDVTSQEAFIDKLLELTNNNIPDYMTGYLLNNKGVRTTRSNLQEHIASIHSEISVLKNMYKHRVKMEDSITFSEKINVVKLGNTVSDKIGQIDYYIQENQWNEAKSVLDSIQINENNEEQIRILNMFNEYVNFRQDLNERSIAQLDSSEIDYLKTLADNDDRVAGYAQNILCFFYDKCYGDTIIIEERSGGEMTNMNTPADPNELLYDLSLSPNPATDNTTIEWVIYDQLENCTYIIQNINNGNIVEQGNINQNEGIMNISVSQFPNGYYVVKIINNGEIKTEKKLVIKE